MAVSKFCRGRKTERQAEQDASKAAEIQKKATADRYQRSVSEAELEHWKAVAATFGKPEKESRKSTSTLEQQFRS